jgi:NAD(P)-dependent dehydrogenase (short-subunit alcohol dehydrogenase family)
MDSVREFAAEFRSSFKQLDFLINNAGVTHQAHCVDAEGHDVNFTTNQLGHFLLTSLLLDLLI